MFDIDHFKQVNDQLGHLHGDRVLQELARLFDESIRETDIVARYGGEEFVVVMPHTDLAGACVFAERLRAVVESQMAITISGGVTAAREGDTQESLIARADAALYGAKSAGRNRVFWSTGEVTGTGCRAEAVSVEGRSSRTGFSRSSHSLGRAAAGGVAGASCLANSCGTVPPASVSNCAAKRSFGANFRACNNSFRATFLMSRHQVLKSQQETPFGRLGILSRQISPTPGVAPYTVQLCRTSRTVSTNRAFCPARPRHGPPSPRRDIRRRQTIPSISNR